MPNIIIPQGLTGDVTLVAKVDNNEADPTTGNVVTNNAIAYEQPSVVAITHTDVDFTIVADTVVKGTWNKISQIDSDAEGWEVAISNTGLNVSLKSPSYDFFLTTDTTISVDGVDKSLLTMKALYSLLKDVFYLPQASGSVAKIYVANISVADSNPIATEFENGLGDITVGTSGNSTLQFTSDGLFTLGKTILPQHSDWAGNNGTFIPVLSNSAIVGYYGAYIISSSLIEIYFKGVDFAPTDMSALFGQTKFPLEIRVYP